MKKSDTISSLDELSNLARSLVANLTPHSLQATVITLSGELGTGKTTLTQMIARELGVTEVVNSPTYVITKYYDLKKQLWKRLIHIDAYRLDGQNLEPLGFEELCSDPNNIIIIEWPQFINSVLPVKKTSITINKTQDENRTLTIS